ncbi:homoserine O-succinyltransferase [Sulfitobacter pseudonitzschiae]|uniref:Homoserine O-acetyltransferase n=1 Tax=Pseudosulfitobacter pseudonitzschiae TaxID=1402135 RepID=A0A9Q2NJI0_9RHOB|nr:homoserine O-succinyltransferase [Pseudosulfitobacter pseudonitzschiae]MBM2292766.1 homoserine O-succinyltransferase [Pseudosulfitobacter pseudonitzschiae]MBM2298138.1 homoserine O-succinyltransferase [Pseudosulfitobacter pseudonitzschiae]MBM2303052.1 homoserine O-succinyltransferase [Pseudosulfitobacter pseudonitzschiae]MBM2312835.1 homoserine O-succinyltransferase [Pseudosulfitobacter pseudonitzschiae]MBM2317748.1 homoserine O-succinyltransferase [Pseudosulfitobacter pseudonitzschiae]
MPIKIPATLPAYDVLTREGVMVLDEELAASQDIRPLRIALLNLMPKKIQTENQFARLIGATPLQIEFSLLRMTDHNTRNTAAEHMEAFYRPVSEVMEEKFDGLIITGAPIEHLDFDEVGYWDELQRVMDWTQTNVHSTFGVCWGGMAMINHFHGVQKHMLEKKAFGCFRHRNLAPASPYLRGFSDDCVIPVSRWTEMRQAEVDSVSALRTLLGSDEVGPCLVEDVDHRALYIFNHFEYDSDTLKQEYDRDVASGTEINVPMNYYPNDDPSQPPQNRWRSHAHLLYGNWINEIYQSTPFDLVKIGT